MKTASFALVLLFVFVSTTVFATPPDELAGSWDYTVDTPDGVYTGQLIFVRNGEGYTGKMVSQGYETELKDLKVDGKDVSFSLYTQGYLVKIKGSLAGDQFNGKVEVEYEYFTLKARRAVEDILAGTWNYTATTPEGVYKGQFIFSKGADGYTGKMVLQENETTLNDVKLQNDQLSFSLNTQGYFVKVKARINGQTLEGKGEVDYEYFPVKGEKIK